jgi:hypothetical protein
MQIGDKVKYQGLDAKIVSLFEDIAYIKVKYAREEEMVAISDLVVIPTEPKVEKPAKEKKIKKYKDAPPIKITREQRGQILKNLVEEESIRNNFKREIMILARLIRKFPHVEFLLEGFKPAIKANSLLYWINRPEVEQLYKTWAISLTTERKEIILSDTKIGEDIITVRKPRNLLDILN